MNCKRILNIALLVILIVLFVTAQNVAAEGKTAKAWIKDATAAAQKWHKDATLVNVSTLQAKPDGTASKWAYMFYSPKAKQGYSIDIKDGKIVETLEVTPYIKDSVGEFVDSDKAMAEAKKNGLKVKDIPAMSVLVMGQATKTSGAYWSVAGYMPGDISVVVNGKTGKFSYKQEIK